MMMMLLTLNTMATFVSTFCVFSDKFCGILLVFLDPTANRRNRLPCSWLEKHKRKILTAMSSAAKSPLKLSTENVRKEWASIYPLDSETEQGALDKLLKDLELKGLDSIDRRFVKNILKLYFTKEYLAGLAEPNRKPSLKILFTSFCIRARLQKQNFQISAIEQDIQMLPLTRPNFPATDDKKELEYLSYFMLSMKDLLNILPGHQNQGLFLGVCALLEGSGKVYKTGGDPSKETRRRMEIFLHLSGVVPTPKKRKVAMTSDDKSVHSGDSTADRLQSLCSSATAESEDSEGKRQCIGGGGEEFMLSSLLLQMKYGKEYENDEMIAAATAISTL